MKPSRSGAENGVDLSIVLECQRGDKAAFHTLFLHYRDPVFRLAFRFTADADDAEDLAQEIFVRVYERIGTFRCESSFSTWLYRLAANHCLNHCRKPDRPRSLEDETHEPVSEAAHPLHASLQTERCEVIHLAIAGLPESLKAVFILVSLEELSYAQAAETLGLTVEAVRMRMSRARRELQNRLKESDAQ